MHRAENACLVVLIEKAQDGACFRSREATFNLALSLFLHCIIGCHILLYLLSMRLADGIETIRAVLLSLMTILGASKREAIHVIVTTLARLLSHV